MKLASSTESHEFIVGVETPHSFASEDSFNSCPILPAHNFKNFTNNFVALFEKMHVTRCNDRLPKVFTKFHDRSVEFAKFFLIRRKSLFQHESVVADRLDLKEIIERRKALQFLPILTRKDRLKQFARFAGRTYNKTFSVFYKLTFRYSRLLVKIIEVTI